MVRMEKVDPSVLQNEYRRTKWQDVIEEFEQQGHEIAHISDGKRKAENLQASLSQCIKRLNKTKTLCVKIIGGECYLMKKELLENGR